MTQDTQIVLPVARLCGKTLQADFDGGTLTSDGGVLLLRETEAHVGVMRRLAEALEDRRDLRYIDAESWSAPHRIIYKAEVSEEGDNLRFVVTNLETPRNQWIYETIYCGHGQMENDIKDHKLFLHSDRTSCHRFAANQFRLLLHSAAYMLMHTLRSIGLQGTSWSRAQVNRMQMRRLKVGARVAELKTNVTFHFPSAFPLKTLYETVLAHLSQTKLCRSPEAVRYLVLSIASARHA